MDKHMVVFWILGPQKIKSQLPTEVSRSGRQKPYNL